MSDMFMDALQNYLNGSEWRESIEMFVLANNKYYNNMKDLSHQQYEIWKNFQDIVENILQMTLMCVGGSIESLEKALDDLKDKPSKGPRDEVIKDVLDKLSSFSNFETFCKMMNKSYKENINNRHLENNNRIHGVDSDSEEENVHLNQQFQNNDTEDRYDMLMKLGFSTENINILESEMSISESSLESLVLRLSEIQSEQYDKQKEEYDQRYQVHQAYFESQTSSSSVANPKKHRHISKHLKAFAKSVKIFDATGLSELQSKFIMADTVLQLFDSNQEDTSQGIQSLTDWANDMAALYDEIITSYDQHIPFQDMKKSFPAGLIKWFEVLEITRARIDDEAVIGNMLSETELLRMAELDRIAAMGTEGEQLLHQLISRHDQVTRDIKGFHNKCGLLIASNQGVSRENLEELYLYLKEQVASGAELDSISEELHDHVYGLISSSKAAEVINLLLDLHILEDEQFMLKRRIDEIVSALSSPSHKDSKSSGNTSPFANQSSFSPLKRKGDFLHDIDLALAESTPIDETAASIDTRADKKDSNTNSTKSAKRSTADRAVTVTTDSKTSESKKALTLDGQDDGSKALKDTKFLDALKAKHKDALSILRSVLDSEKNKKLKELEDKLLRRKAQKKATVTECQNKELGPLQLKELSNIVEEIDEECKQLEENIDTVQKKYDEMTEGMVSGFKKKCLQEVKMIRSMNEGKGKPSYQLSETDAKEANRAAAEELKRRFERDQRALIDALEADRKRQREKIFNTLAKRKKLSKNANNPDEILNLEDKMRKELLSMNEVFDNQESVALAKAQEQVLLALSGIYIDSNLLDHSKDASDALDTSQDDGDQYFEDSDEKGRKAQSLLKNGAKDWLDKIEKVKDEYLSAGTALQSKLRTAHESSLQAEEQQEWQSLSTNGMESSGIQTKTEGEDTSGFSALTAHMMKVITEAFDHHLVDAKDVQDNDSKSNKKSNPLILNKENSKADRDRVKAGILEEFEKTKLELDNALNHSKTKSYDRLKNKLNKNRTNVDAKEVKGDGGSMGQFSFGNDLKQLQFSQGLLEQVIDDFLENPLGSSGSNSHGTSKPVRGVDPSTDPSTTLRDISKQWKTAAVVSAKNNIPPASSRDVKQIVVESIYDDNATQEDPSERGKGQLIRIKSMHRKKEEELISGLQSSMTSKKKQLEERLKKKKLESQRVNELESESGIEGRGVIAANEAMEIEKEIKIFSQSYEIFLKFLNDLSFERKEHLSSTEWMKYVQRHANGEELMTLQEEIMKRTDPILNNMLIMDQEEKDDTDDGVNMNGQSVHGTGGGTKGPGGGNHDEIGKQILENEVKRISNLYNEENQKLDLMMKIQQARQRQTLQRKLMERRQQQELKKRQTNAVEMSSSSNTTEKNRVETLWKPVESNPKRGYRRIMEVEADDYENGDDSDETFVQLKYKGPTAGYNPNQPIAKGLIETNNLISPTASNNTKTSNSFASRGLSLGPMMKK